MLKVKFYNEIDDKLLSFAVITAKSDNHWVFCKHKERDTLEVPGGHREPGELILDTAKRELQEETGAIEFEICPVSIYSVITTKDDSTNNTEETFGMLYFADIKSFGKLPDFEMEKVIMQDTYPEQWTYPLIQPILMEKIKEFLDHNNINSSK